MCNSQLLHIKYNCITTRFIYQTMQMLGMVLIGHLHQMAGMRSEEHTSELQSHSDLHSFPTRRSSDLTSTHKIQLHHNQIHLPDNADARYGINRTPASNGWNEPDYPHGCGGCGPG